MVASREVAGKEESHEIGALWWAWAEGTWTWYWVGPGLLKLGDLAAAIDVGRLAAAEGITCTLPSAIPLHVQIKSKPRGYLMLLPEQCDPGRVGFPPSSAQQWHLDPSTLNI